MKFRGVLEEAVHRASDVGEELGVWAVPSRVDQQAVGLRPSQRAAERLPPRGYHGPHCEIAWEVLRPFRPVTEVVPKAGRVLLLERLRIAGLRLVSPLQAGLRLVSQLPCLRDLLLNWG